MGRIAEVACCVADYKPTGKRMLLDVDHVLPDRTMAGSQALYDIDDLIHPLAINTGATLSWGGPIQWRGRWLQAQGWDTRPGVEEAFFYSADVSSF